MLNQNPLRAALWMSCTVLCFSLMAVAVRELLRHMEVFEILFLRTLVSLLIVLAVVPRFGIAPLRTRRFSWHFWRAMMHLGGQVCWIYAIAALALATVFAIEFTMPVWVALLAFFVLGERLNQGRVVMLILGLAGIAIILRPGVGAFHPAALVMVLGSVFYAGNIIMTKRLSATDAPLSVLFWMSVVQIPPTLAAALPQWVTPRLADLPWILAIGGGSYAAHYSLTRAMKLGDATLVMPIDFLRLPLIAVIGALAYAEPLEAAVFVGAAVIFAGTYYSLARESRRA
jgi:drug/metabolite transporter (DMT)-like permease